MTIAHFIDHTVLKPTTTLADIEKVCEEAARYKFASVCVPPYYVRDARLIAGTGGVPITTVIGFPFGYSHFTAKEAEMHQALADGASELDMVINLAALHSNDIAYLETEIGTITKLLEGKEVVLKLIIESGILSNEQIIRCCALYRHYPVQFLKTSTGYAEKGASVAAIQLMRQHLPPSIQLKASGGVKTFAFAQELIHAGASRLGCSASIAIVEGAGNAEGGGY